MEELELRVTSLEKQVEYEGLNINLDQALNSATNIAKNVSNPYSVFYKSTFNRKETLPCEFITLIFIY